MIDWFEEWFGEEYLALYPHRDEEEANAVARLVAARLDPPPGARVLDLACGAGRHLRALAERWAPVGLDLSPALLRVARSLEPDCPLVRADMRELPFGTGVFDLVVNLFTSFGYFRDDEQHQRVIAEIGRVTRPGGWFVFDYLNPPHVRATLIPHDEQRIGSRVVEQERQISPDGRFVQKTITLWDEGRLFVERVRLYEKDDLIRMLSRCCFRTEYVCGDYDGAPHSAASPRTLLFATRA